MVGHLGWDGGVGCSYRGTGVSDQRIGQLEAKLLWVVREEPWWGLPEGAEACIGETEKNLGG